MNRYIFVGFIFSGLSVLAQSNVNVPEQIAVPTGTGLIGKISARGVQIYTCQQNQNGQFEWVFKAPEADLYSENGVYFGKHYAGPTWELLNGTIIKGTVLNKINSTEQNAIPWLLLKTNVQNSVSEYGQTAYIQRLETVGGKASGICDWTMANQELRSPYSAVYYFYKS